jgi:hypothetical protein
VNASLVELEDRLSVTLVNGAVGIEQRAVEIRDEQLVRQIQLATLGYTETRFFVRLAYSYATTPSTSENNV